MSDDDLELRYVRRNKVVRQIPEHLKGQYGVNAVDTLVSHTVLQYRRQIKLLSVHTGHLRYDWTEWTDVPVVDETMGS